ncbi:type III-B CRISPR module RAMP protein Cmr1 [Thermococcus waiotapuensis]|uniref:Type III-B CRISPR module RAMP protein Cmr1 n=1 Tax=Thermococcus waiotapuensis TaxID=90909 RepID=A0AAE4NWY0_9EURY|nr:type III-B CRISPR module RAMP protein Cmr1 [Thermococcus waiotapuensis]MDV3104832.1 type III-B CRISPR module RAMP protein Cmr1 [Thermococcus waiotapuensis]
MYRATFELEAITPVFMRGADQGRAEFRAASVKGVMRWWFRALAGAYLGNDVKTLREIEGRIFGSAGSGRSRRSLVTVSAKALSEPTPLSVNPSAKGFLYNETSYLFFSVKMGLNKFSNVPTHYPAGSKFQVTISSPDRDAFVLASASLWLATTLGGFGFRARRGAGSLGITKVSFSNEKTDEEIRKFLKTIETATLYDLKKILDETLRESAGRVFRKNSRQPLQMPSFPNLAKIIVLVSRKSYQGPMDALKSLQEAYAGRYNSYKRAYTGGVRFGFAHREFSSEAIGNLLGGKTKEEYRYYFGTPVVYANWKVEVRGLGGEKEFSRRASSLILTVKKIKGSYYPVVVIVPYQYLPGHRGKFRARKGNTTVEIEVLTPQGTAFTNEDFVEWVTTHVVNGFKGRGFEEVYP